MSGRARLGLAAGYAVCTFLSFPHPIGDRVIDLGAGLAWFGPALLLLALRGLGPGRAALWGGLAVWAAYSAILHWIYVVTVEYGHAPPVAGVIAPLLLAGYIALFGVVFGASWAALERRGFASPFAAAALWTALDHLRSFALTGFPWATLGYAQHLNPALLGLAPITGVYGLSFVTALGGAALADLFVTRRAGRRPGPATLAALGGVLLAMGLGLAVPDPESEPADATLRVGVLQGNIDQGVKWSEAWVDRTLGIYEELTRSAAARGAQLVVWPETAVPGTLEASPMLRERIEALARETGLWLVVGGVGLAFDIGQPRPTDYFDSAFVVDSAGTFRDRYDKTHLVPFGEYVPLRDLIGLFVREVASGIAASGVTPGPAPRAVLLEPSGASPLLAGLPICYELLFPDLMRRFAGDGAQLLLAITNDAWYGRTGAPYQFLAITALRSAESGLWTARAANTGVSALIDGRGRVRARTAIFERDLLVADVPLRPERRPTFYVRAGDWLAWLCWAALVGLAGASVFRGRRSTGGDTGRRGRRSTGGDTSHRGLRVRERGE